MGKERKMDKNRKIIAMTLSLNPTIQSLILFILATKLDYWSEHVTGHVISFRACCFWESDKFKVPLAVIIFVNILCFTSLESLKFINSLWVRGFCSVWNKCQFWMGQI